MLRRTAPVVFALLAAAIGHANPLTVSVATPTRPESGYFAMGTARNPSGHILTLDSRSLRYDGRAWMPVMGEFHYSRYPAEEWREELLKMKAGGVDIVATYVFWIHHEEFEGAWNWSGDHDLRRFVQTAHEVGLDVVVRCGPWCHGEVRNGGLPEWVVSRPDLKIRSTDPKFLELVRELYRQIALQLRGLLWKDGGPVIGIQVDNEYRGPAAYLLTLKSIAREVGLDVPLYTRTGWPALTTPMPVGEIVPLYGVYAEGFWDRQLTSMPGRYWAGFQFSALRTDAAIATEMLGNRAAADDADTAKYPYLTCEIGGGMMTSYHRRILVDPRDVEATTLVKIAGGSTMPGYYMYHGGTNPDGYRTTLMEAQDTLLTNYNDLPVKTYDFQAPLGEFGQLRTQYHWLRRLHLFLHDYGADLTAMTTALPDRRPAGRDDTTTLRWAVRSDGRRGFVFVNNYERGRRLPPKTGVQFAIGLADGSALAFPTAPVTVPEGAIFWWPFNIDVGGVTVTAATAMPFSHVVEANGTKTVFFAATPGIPTEFILPADQIARIETGGRMTNDAGRIIIRDIPAGREAAVRLVTKQGDVRQFVVLDELDSLAFWKGSFAGRSRVILARAAVVFDGDVVRVTATRPGKQPFAVFPAAAEISIAGTKLSGRADGLFQEYSLPIDLTTTAVPFEQVQAAGALRQIKAGPIKEPVAMQPKDADFSAAAIWRVELPSAIDFTRQPLLRFNYVGDVAWVYLGNRLLTDDFYNGKTRDLGLWRYARDIGHGELQFAVIPLQRGAPIFLADSARPDFGDAPAVAALRSVDLLQASTVTVTGQPFDEPGLPQNFRTDAATPRPNRP